MNGRWYHLILGSLLSLFVVLATAVFSSWPLWQSMPTEGALLRLSFTQSGVRDCRERTAEELAALPRNMRQAQICERRRAPVHVEMELNGEMVFSQTVAPSGLSGTGPSRVYERFELAAGTYDVRLRLRDDPASEDFTSSFAQSIELDPAQSLAIDFNAQSGGFFIHK